MGSVSERVKRWEEKLHWAKWRCWCWCCGYGAMELSCERSVVRLLLLNHLINPFEKMSISATRPRNIAADYSDFPTRRNFTIKGFLSHWIQLAWSSQFWQSAESCMSKFHIMRARMRRISRYARLSFRQLCCSCGENEGRKGRSKEGSKEERDGSSCTGDWREMGMMTHFLPMQLRGPREKGWEASLLSDVNSLSPIQRSGMKVSGYLKLPVLR